MNTTARTQANRRNAQRSTGPKTTAGKAIAAGNARRHGLLSRELILPGEAREDFELLLEELQHDWQPDGITENLLVERIAVALWRQQRIIRAETAEIHLQQQAADPPYYSTITPYFQNATSDDASEVLRQYHLPLLAKRDLWQDALDALQQSTSLPDEMPCHDQFAKLLPPVAAGISVLAQYFQIEPDDWLARFIATDEHSYDIALENAFRLERLRWDYLPIREHLLATHAIPRGIERLTRYQAALDNDLYKALRELRMQQSYRAQRASRVITADEIAEDTA